MLRGLSIGNIYREHRLVSAYWAEKEEEIAKTKALIYASLGLSDKAVEELNKYIRCIFPSDKYNEEMIEKNKEIIKAQENVEMRVHEVDM